MTKIELPDSPQDRTEFAVHGLPSIDALEPGARQWVNIIDFVPDATFVIDRTGKVIAWNRAIEIMTRVQKPEIVGKGCYAYAVPFYGKSRPILIDLALNPAAEGAGAYDFLTRNNDTIIGETYVPDAYGGAGAYLRGVASALHDQDRNLIGAIEFIRDISSRKSLEESLRQRENELEDKTGQLQQINTTLKVLLKDREDDRRRIENDIQSNLKQLVLPYLTSVKKGTLDQNQKTYLELVESSLNKILSPFIANMSSAFHSLSHTEIQIAHLIIEGEKSKDIASLLHVARKTVETHRYNLRIKLGIQNEKINLRTYLLSIK